MLGKKLFASVVVLCLLNFFFCMFSPYVSCFCRYAKESASDPSGYIDAGVKLPETMFFGTGSRGAQTTPSWLAGLRRTNNFGQSELVSSLAGSHRGIHNMNTIVKQYIYQITMSFPAKNWHSFTLQVHWLELSATPVSFTARIRDVQWDRGWPALIHLPTTVAPEVSC